MEGGGEGMMAVVRGTKHALTVTLLSDHRGSIRKCFDTNKKSTRVSHLSVETNTDRSLWNANTISDVRYSSNYGFTGCQFPKPSAAYPQLISSQLKSQDPFTQSLRKYPAERSSTELIQRIINYTRAKNNTRKRYSRIRSLIRKSKSQTQDLYSNTVAAQGENNCDEVYNSLPSIKSKNLSQNELVNYTYDYLKSSSLVPRSTDVRYFTEVKRAIRGRLRGMIDEKPAVCPWIQNRYNRHRQHCFRKNVKTPSKIISRDIESQETRKNAPIDSNGMPALKHTVSSNIISCQSGRKPCFCNRLSPRDDDNQVNEQVNTHEQVPNLSNLHPEVSPANKVIPSQDISNEYQLQASDAFTIDASETKNETLENEINEWLKTIPVYPNFGAKEKVKQEQLINELIKILKILQKELNFPELAKKEVTQCLDVLPMWCPEDPENKMILKDQIANDLIERLANLAVTNFKTTISEVVKGLPFDVTNINDYDVKKTIDIFVDKLKPIALNRPLSDEDYKEKLKLEVNDILKKIPLRLDKQNSDQIVELADKFVEHLYHLNIFNLENKQPLVDIETDKIEKKIFDWCLEIPEFSKYSAIQYTDLVKYLAQKLNIYNLQDIKDKNVLWKLQNEIYLWLNRLAIRMKINFSSESINILSNNLIERILGPDSTSIVRNNSNEDDTLIKTLQCIIEWIQKIPELSIENNDEIHLKALAFQLKEIQIRGDPIENILADIKETISNWLQQILKIKGMRLDSKTQDNLVNDLLLKLTHIVPRKCDENSDENKELRKDIITWLKLIPFMRPHDDSDQNNLVKEFVVRLMEIKGSRNKDTIKSIIEEEINKFIKKLPVNSITSDDIEKLKLKVFTQINIDSLPQRRKLWDKGNNLRHILYEEISNIFDPCPIHPKELKESLKTKVTNLILKNIIDNTIGWDKTCAQVINILNQDTSLPKSDIEKLGNKIFEKANNILDPHESTRISAITTDQTGLKFNDRAYKTLETKFLGTQMDKHMNKSLEDNENIDFENQMLAYQNQKVNQNNNMNLDMEYISKLKLKTKNTSEKNIKDISIIQNNKSQSDILSNTSHKIDSQVRDNFSNVIGNVKNDNDTTEKKYVNNLNIIRNIDKTAKEFDQKLEERKALRQSRYKSANDSKNMNNSKQTETKTDRDNEKTFLENDFSTSTPITSSIKYPSAISLELFPFLNTSLVTKTHLAKEVTSEVSQYLNKLKIIIENWLNHFALNLNEKEKCDLINNIAYDVLDRQKYLQLSETSMSENDELEHLKYQIYKRLHNHDNHDVIRDIISNVDCLNHRIMSLGILKFIQPTYSHKLQKSTDLDLISINIADIMYKINIWFKKLSQTFTNSLKDGKYYEQSIRELARNLETLKTNNHYDNVHIEKEILQWLSIILNNVDSKKLNDLVDSLKLYLYETHSAETLIPIQDTSEFIVENLSGAIIEWFRTSQYRFKLQNQIQDYLALNLANDIKQVFAQSLSDDELNRLLIQEIMSDLGKITGDLSHSVFHYGIACDLVRFLKQLKLFHDISDREVINNLNTNNAGKNIEYKDEIKEVILNWFKKLPLHESITITDIEHLINNFIEEILNNHEFDDIINVEDILKDNILRLLNKIPLIIENQEYHNLEVQAETLVSMIKDVMAYKNTITKFTRDSKLQVKVNQVESPRIIYKQLLHDTISKTFFEKLTLKEQISFNLLKEKLANAFVDLHHFTDDHEVRFKFKNKLYIVISKFCDDYLKRLPLSPIDTDRVQEDLHEVLKNVSFPRIWSKIDEDKLKDELNKWFKTIPMTDCDKKDTPDLICTLASRLYPLFNKSELNKDTENEIKHEIIKWLQKIPLKTEGIINREEIAHKLMRTLKLLLNFKYTNDNDVFSNEFIGENEIAQRKEASTQFTPQLPPTSLSVEETDHLKRIRARSDIRSQAENYERSIITNAYSNAGIQTNINDKVTKSVQTSDTSVNEKFAIHKEISPHVVIREFYWDSNGSGQSFQMFEPPAISPEKIITKTKVTSKSQTEPNDITQNITQRISETQLEARLEELLVTKDVETQTSIDQQNVNNKTHTLLQSQLFEGTEPHAIPIQDLTHQQDKLNGTRKSFPKRRERVGEVTDKTFVRETIEDYRRKFKTPRATPPEVIPPVLITEKTSERRFYASPEYIDARQSREDKICCSCQNHLLTKCRNKAHSGCRQTSGNTLKHCSKCFGGYCPHPSYFFFRKDF